MVQKKAPKLDTSKFEHVASDFLRDIKDNPNFWAYSRAIAAGYTEQDAIQYFLTEDGNDQLYRKLYSVADDFLRLIPDSLLMAIINDKTGKKLEELYKLLNGKFVFLLKEINLLPAQQILENTFLERLIMILHDKMLEKAKINNIGLENFVDWLFPKLDLFKIEVGFKNMIAQYFRNSLVYSRLSTRLCKSISAIGEIENTFTKVDTEKLFEDYPIKYNGFEHTVNYERVGRLISVNVKLLLDGVDRVADAEITVGEGERFALGLRYSDAKVILHIGSGIPVEDYFKNQIGFFLQFLILDAVSKTVKEAPDAYVESQPVTPQTVKNETVAQVAEVVVTEDFAPQVQEVSATSLGAEETVAKANNPKRLPLALFNNINTSELIRALVRLGVNEGRTGKHKHFTFNGISLPLPVHGNKPVSPKIIYGNLVRWGIDPCLFLDEIRCDYSRYMQK